ncbi:MAG: hypothetical protein K0B06_06860 [Brevefilum sp.]|nr:hypothetical protein [Brevefilum sp.]
MDKSYQPQKLIFGVLFLLFLVVFILIRSATTRFASKEIRQENSNLLLPVYANTPISQDISNLKVDAIVFFPKLINISQSVRHPLYIKILFHNSGLVQQQKCPLFQIMFFQQCKITGILQIIDQENPAKITFFSDAPQGVYGIWGTIRKEDMKGDEIQPQNFYKTDLEFYGYDRLPNIENIKTTFHYFLISIAFSLFSVSLGVGPVYLLYHSDELNWISFLILSIFLGVAVIILFLLICGLSNIPYRYVPILTIIILIGNFISILIKIIKNSDHFIKVSFRKDALILVTTFLFATWIYSWQISEVIAPLWFDGLYHYQLVESILFSNNLLTGTIYPTGFHALVVFLHQLIGVKTHLALLLVGQWVILISGLSFFVFTQKVTKSFGIALIGLLFFWFLSPFPNYLVNWSRFPFAMGLALISICLFLSIKLLDNSKHKLLLSVLLFLLAFTHYGAFLLFSAGLLSVLVIYLPKDKKLFSNLTKNRGFLGLFVVLLVSVGYLLIRVINLFFSNDWISIVNQNRFNADNVDYVYAFGLTMQKGGWVLYLISILCVIILLKKSDKVIFFFILWAIFANAIILLFKFILGASILSFENLIYYLPIPMSMLAGMYVIYASESIKSYIRFNNTLIYCNKSSKSIKLLGWTLLIICTLFSGYHQSSILNPRVVMVTDNDLDAFIWIDMNTAKSSKFLVDSILWGNQYKPIGSGGWITAFTNREVYYPESISDKSLIPSLIENNGINYLFLREGVGEIYADRFTKYPIVYQRGDIRIINLELVHEK